MKQQLVFIHGGMTFARNKEYLEYLRTREISLKKHIRWNDKYLERSLGRKFSIIRPRMHLVENARYEDWEIQCDRYIPFLRDGVIFTGFSLGGVFLAKYLSRRIFPRKISLVVLVAPPFDNTLPGEDLSGGFALSGDVFAIQKNCKKIHLFFSSHDEVVSLDHCKKYAKKLPFATIHILHRVKGHFQGTKFPEFVSLLKEKSK